MWKRLRFMHHIFILFIDKILRELTNLNNNSSKIIFLKDQKQQYYKCIKVTLS